MWNLSVVAALWHNVTHKQDATQWSCCSLQAFPGRSLAAESPPALVSAESDPAIAVRAEATVADLVAPNATISGLVSPTLLNDAAYVAAPVPPRRTRVLNISATNASASVLVRVMKSMLRTSTTCLAAL